MTGCTFNRSSAQPVDPQLQRLHFLVSGLCSRFRLGTLAFVQVWMENTMASDSHEDGTALACSPHQPFFVGLPLLNDFRTASCEHGVSTQELGLLGRAFTGSLQVVQNLAIVPKSQHPRNKLRGHESSIAEVVYMPVYDLEKLDCGVFAVIEIMLSAAAHEPMAVANLITYASRFMEDVMLSISYEDHQEITARSSSSSSSNCSMPPALERPSPRWHVSPRVDASDAHRPSISRDSWALHPTASPSTSSLLMHDSSGPSSPSSEDLAPPLDPPCSASVPTLIPTADFNMLQLHHESPQASADLRSYPVHMLQHPKTEGRHRMEHVGSRPGHGAEKSANSDLISPFSAVSPLQSSPPRGQHRGGLKRNSSLARTTSSRSLSDLTSASTPRAHADPLRASSSGEACPAIPEVSSSPPPALPTWEPSPEVPSSPAAAFPTRKHVPGVFADPQPGPCTREPQHLCPSGRTSPILQDMRFPPHGNEEMGGLGNASCSPPELGAGNGHTVPSSLCDATVIVMQPAAAAPAEAAAAATAVDSAAGHPQEHSKMPWWHISAPKFSASVESGPPLQVC